jgi:hypothetical protein
MSDLVNRRIGDLYHRKLPRGLMGAGVCWWWGMGAGCLLVAVIGAAVRWWGGCVLVAVMATRCVFVGGAGRARGRRVMTTMFAFVEAGFRP